MSAFLVRFLFILILFALGAVLGSLTANSALAIPLWFIAVTVWTLELGFRRALLISIPFLILADVLWDGKLGPLFIAGFLLATATTYLTLRIETSTRTLQTAVYSLLIALFSALALWGSIINLNTPFELSVVIVAGKTFAWQLLVTILFILPLTWVIHTLENWLDTSYREQAKKIR